MTAVAFFLFRGAVMQLEFLVKQQHIVRMDSMKVVADSRNYLFAHFSFSDDWTGIKTTVFRKDNQSYEVILEDDVCPVPWEVLTAGTLYISVFAGDLITADRAEVIIAPSGYERGKKPKAPTPNVYEQIIKMVEEISGTGSVLVDTAVTFYRLKKNVFTMFSKPLSALKVELEMTEGYAEYNFSFKVGADDFALSIPEGYLWDGDELPIFEKGKVYEVSICSMDHIAVASRGAVYE